VTALWQLFADGEHRRAKVDSGFSGLFYHTAFKLKQDLPLL